jgi:hypothetical protein
VRQPACLSNQRAAMHRTHLCPRLIALGTLACSGIALAHHTFSMFDTSRQFSVSGVVAKFEWKNPHAYLWVYVPSTTNAGKYDAWAFENGSPSLLSKMGWSKESLQPNDKVTVTYAPLRDGRPGGHCLKVTLSSGRSLECQGFETGTAARR